jgi:hypothetical protein
MCRTRSLFRALVAALALLAATGEARAAGGVDLTNEFLGAYRNDCAIGPAHREMLRRHKVLLVPGYFGNLNPGYFGTQLRWLASIGVEHEKVAVRPGQSVAINAPIVSAAIRDSAKPVVIITHSKGSVDTLEALLAEAELRKKVKGWISLQGAFFGTPVADMLLDGSLLDPVVSSFVLEFFGGTKVAAEGLTTRASRAYYRERVVAIARVVREVPAVAFASALDGEPGAGTRTLLEIPRELMRRDGIRSDGLVPLDSAVLPGMDFVKISGVDHIAPVMPALQSFDRVRMTGALLLLVMGESFRGLPRDPRCKGAR